MQWIIHDCPNCGKRRHTSLRGKVENRYTQCMNCNHTYMLRRVDHIRVPMTDAAKIDLAQRKGAK